LVTGLAHALQINLRFRDATRQLQDVSVTRLAGNLAGEHGDLVAKHGVGEDG
jgi:hypothetical protein